MRAAPRLPVVYHDAYEVDLGPHVFPVAKYRLVRDRLIAEGILTEASLHRPVPARDADVGLVHTADYLGKIRDGSFTPRELATLEVPLTPSLREASWLCAEGSLRTARLALEHGIAVHLGGGFHHAFPDHGEGFCLINDVAVAIQVLRREAAIRRALVVDLDVHHGNGTALIFAGDPEVFCFSMHQQNNYPAWKPAGSLDVGLADGTGDDAYLALLDSHLDRILATHAPQLVWYLAGADPYEHDQLGGLRLTMAGLRRRDEMVLSAAQTRGTPVAVALAGGYAARLEDTVEIHCQTVRAAAAVMAAD